MLLKRSPITRMYASSSRHTMVVSFLTTLCIIIILATHYLLRRPTFNSSCYLQRQRKYLSTGLSFSQTWPTPSTSRLYERRRRLSVERSLARAGLDGFSDVGLRFNLGSLPVWIQSMPKPSTILLWDDTLISCSTSSGSMIFLWKISITWMKKVASMEVGERSLVGSILCPVLDVHDIDSVVQISSLLQSLNVFVQMVLLCFQALCFLGRSSLQNGLKLTQKSGTHKFILVIYVWSDLDVLVFQCQTMGGHMTFCVRNGSRSLSFPRIQPVILQANPFSSFMMVMDLTTLLNSLSLLAKIMSFCFVYHLILLINFSLLILASLVLFRVHGLSGAMKLLRILQQRCLERILLRNTWLCEARPLSHRQYAQHGGRAAAGQLIPPSSRMMTLHQVFPLPQL